MDEFQEDENDDIELNAPLDIRFVVIGLLMMITGLFFLPFAENIYLKVTAISFLILSPFVMTKTERTNNLL